MTDRVVRARAVLPTGLTPDLVDIHIEGSRIVGVGPPDPYLPRRELDPAPSLVDDEGFVTAGFLDVHTHGAVGRQVIDGHARDVATLAQFYARHGVTGFLATVGGSRRHIEAGIAAVAGYRRLPAEGGATCLGIHLEGPFISDRQPGAFQLDSIARPDARLFEHYADLAADELKLMTIAPEVPGADAVIAAAIGRGVRCSAGHSAATAEQMSGAIDAGVRSVTHMFNAMTPFHHRNPGIQGVAMTDTRVIAEVVADGVHVDPVALRLLLLAKGIDGIALVTDSIGAAGLADGEYEFEEQAIIVRNGEARLHDGTLAGSTLTMDRAINQFAGFGGIPWDQAVIAGTAVPARLLGLENHKGHIAVGMDADLVAVDRQGSILWTMVGGEIVHLSREVSAG